MGVKPGYKRTEVGVIPEEWEVIPLGAVAQFRTGPFGSALHKSDYTTDGIPVINPMHIIDGELSPSTQMSITEVAAQQLSEFRLKAGEVVLGRRGDMGRCALVQRQHEGWLCGTGSMIGRPGSAVDPGFLSRILSSPSVVASIEEASVGSTMINLNQGTLRSLLVQLPPVSEQRAIATALSDVDALLTQLDRLIAKKRDIKQAAMQQLLIGKTRLPGFDGEWKAKRLGDLGEFLKGSGVTRDQSNSGDLPCIRYGEIYTSHNDVVRAFQSFISHSVAATALRLRKGDILFAGSGETKEEIGKCVAFVDDFEAYAGGDIVVLRPRSADAVFIGYALNAPAVAKQKASRGQGDAVVHISAAALADIEVALPEVAEQTAIATLLSDLDAELSALEARRDKTRALKQGMMQELLTGRTRLI